MAQSSGLKEYRTFVKGIITEGNPLTYPENSSKDESNFDLKRDGSRHRRLGIDFEVDHVVNSVALDAALYPANDTTLVPHIKEAVWEYPNLDTSLYFGVVQMDTKILFFDLTASNPSGNLLGTIEPLNSDSGKITGECSFTNINGKLIVSVSNHKDIFIVTYDDGAGTFSYTYDSLKVRDLFGVEDGLAVDENPAVLSNEHNYNLLNQGWVSRTTPNARIDKYFTDQGDYPSNADIAAFGKTSTGTWNSDYILITYFGSTPAPKGYFTIDLMDRSTSREAAVDPSISISLGLDQTTGTGASTIAEYSGRVFFAGFNDGTTIGTEATAPTLGSMVFFSQLASDEDKIFKCYQEADPTSEHISDLVATDGGYIVIPDAKNILKIIPSQSSLLIVADNGVWELYSEGGGFSADNYSISKVTNIGAMSKESIVDAEGVVFYWAKGGIYVLAPDNVTGRFAADNISVNTIQTLYTELPSTAKQNAKGVYDPFQKKIFWLYNTNSTYYPNLSHKTYYSEMLIFDGVLQAFYKYDLSEVNATWNSPVLVGAFVLPSFQSNIITNTVVDSSGNIVVDSSGNTVITQTIERGLGGALLKWIVLIRDTTYNLPNVGLTFADFYDDSFVDWYSYDTAGVDYTSYLLTGHELAGDSVRQKQSPYFIAHFNRTETGFTDTGTTLVPVNPSSCLVQARWDFSDSSTSGKYGTQFQAYRLRRLYVPADATDTFDYGYEVVTTKSKLRGRGKALQLYISSEAGKDMQILGWALQFTMAGNV